MTPMQRGHKKRSEDEQIEAAAQRLALLQLRKAGRKLRDDVHGDKLMRAYGHLNKIVRLIPDEAPDIYLSMRATAEKAAAPIRAFVSAHGEAFAQSDDDQDD